MLLVSVFHSVNCSVLYFLFCLVVLHRTGWISAFGASWSGLSLRCCLDQWLFLSTVQLSPAPFCSALNAARTLWPPKIHLSSVHAAEHDHSDFSLPPHRQLSPFLHFVPSLLTFLSSSIYFPHSFLCFLIYGAYKNRRTVGGEIEVVFAASWWLSFQTISVWLWKQELWSTRH